MSAERRAARDRAIAAALAEPDAPAEAVAGRFGLSARQVRRIAAQVARDNASVAQRRDVLAPADPLDPVRDALGTFTFADAVLRKEATGGDSSAARVGAARTLLRVAEDRVSLYVVLGVVPRSASDHLRTERLRHRVRAALDAARAEEDPRVIAALSRVIESTIGAQTRAHIEADAIVD